MMKSKYLEKALIENSPPPQAIIFTTVPMIAPILPNSALPTPTTAIGACRAWWRVITGVFSGC